jgi:hypothetical protein
MPTKLHFQKMELFIRVLPCGHSHIQFDRRRSGNSANANQGPANVRLRRNVAFKSEMNVPLLERRTHVLDECSDHIFKVSYKFGATFLICNFKLGGISHEIGEGVLRD